MSNLNKILIGVLTIQLALFFVVRAQGGETTIAKAKPLLPNFKSEAATKVQIFDSTEDGTAATPAVVLAKKDDNWTVSSHGDYPADGATIATFVGKFGAMLSRGPLAKTAKRHDQLRVGESNYARKIVIDTAGASHTIYLGVSPKFRKTAVRIGKAADTYAVTQPTTSDAATSVTDWIDPVYSELNKADIVSLSIDNKGGTIALERGADKVWKTAGAVAATGPTALPIDQAAVGKLVDAVAKITMTDVVAKTAAPSHGFDKAAARITVGLNGPADKTGGAPQREVFIVELGAKADGSYLVRSLDKGFVVKVAAAAFAPLVETTAKQLEAKPGDAAKPPSGAPQLPPGMRLPPGTKLPPGFKMPPGMGRSAPRRPAPRRPAPRRAPAPR